MRAVCGRTMPMSIAIPLAGGAEGRAPRGRLMPAVTGRSPRQALLDPGAPGILFFLSFWLGGVALLATALRSVGAEERKGWGKGWGEARGTHLAREPALGSQTTGQWRQLPRRHFLPEQPGSSVLCQPSLRAPCLLFSKQAPWRSRDFSLDGDWARVPHMEAPLLEPLGVERVSSSPPHPDPLQFSLWTDFEGAGFLLLVSFYAHCLRIITLRQCQILEFCIRC